MNNSENGKSGFKLFGIEWTFDENDRPWFKLAVYCIAIGTVITIVCLLKQYTLPAIVFMKTTKVGSAVLEYFRGKFM